MMCACVFIEGGAGGAGSAGVGGGEEGYGAHWCSGFDERPFACQPD